MAALVNEFGLNTDKFGQGVAVGDYVRYLPSGASAEVLGIISAADTSAGTFSVTYPTAAGSHTTATGVAQQAVALHMKGSGERIPT